MRLLCPPRGIARVLLLTAAILLLHSHLGFSGQNHFESRLFLQKYMRFSNNEMADLQRGEVVSRTVKTVNSKEVAAFGAVGLDIPVDYFLSRYRDIVHFKEGRQVVAIGKFSDPPRIEDLNKLAVDSGDLKSIKECEVGDCGVKMSAANIGAFRKLETGDADWNNRAESLLRQMLLDSVTAYLSKGNASLGEYNDRKKPLKLSDEFLSILDEYPYLFACFPEFRNYLEKFPASPLENSENFVYWSKEKFGMKPVVSLTHVTMYYPPEETGMAVIISTRQIYASHYFDGSMGMAMIPGKRSDDRFLLMYLNRSRADALKGAFASIKRAIVESRAQESMLESLKLIRERLSSAYRKEQN